MKRKAFILSILSIILIGVACSRNETHLKYRPAYSDFEKNLNSNMTYDLIVARFGEPTSDIGSGIHIYIYLLNDSSEMWIGYTDRILYARHMDANQQLLDSLI
jgi:hypothetical protein